MHKNSKGLKNNRVNRQLLASNTVQGKDEDPNGDSYIETPGLHGKLRKAALRWGIYSFPVIYAPLKVEAQEISWLPRWQNLSDAEKGEAVDNLFAMYNGEENNWVRAPLKAPSCDNFRIRTRLVGHPTEDQVN